MTSWDPVWDDVFQQSEWGRYPPEYVIRFVARNWYSAADRSAVKLLDLGCGPGACTWYMAREGFSVAGVDGSPTAIQRAGMRLRAEGLDADLRVQDFVNLSFDDSTFDGAIDNAAIYTNRFAMAQQAVREVHRVLKPGGAFLSSSFTENSWGAGCGREIEPGGFTDITEGPLHGKGFSLFMNRDQIERLYSVFDDVAVETVSWTAERMKHKIEFWVVTCRKSV